ncbi:GNAT family N-acetyltransferase [Pseudoroseicyclus sp. CXY001]|uniref:GNAT family N-acetyltransferase n=1 Tax=Pseudoroseicyclus sp. CXY001 TaxID=3242492 RepID=UPI0035711F49
MTTAQDMSQSRVQPVIEAERFSLRPLRPSDAGLISHYAGDRRLARATPNIPHPYPPGAAEAFIARASADDRIEDVWALDSSASGGSEFLGLVVLTPLERAQTQVRYWVAPAFWNTGLATEALRALIAANPHDSAQLFAEVFQDNPGSARVLTNCGFDYLGDAEAFCLARDANVPTWTYTLKLKR